MLDVFVDWVFLLILIVPVVVALGTAALRWGRDAFREKEASTSRETAAVTVVGLFPDGSIHNLRLTNEGSAPARDVHVYVNNSPVTAHQGGANAAPHPLPELAPGETVAYRYASGPLGRRDTVLVRVEWEDPSGGGVEETVVRVP